jgi:hypothetical protein
MCSPSWSATALCDAPVFHFHAVALGLEDEDLAQLAQDERALRQRVEESRARS